ncbi:hypothetical protein H4S02_011660, partial [Coemansia sp. RSA 2611]
AATRSLSGANAEPGGEHPPRVSAKPDDASECPQMPAANYQQPCRTKRLLDPFELMDIEPPRRRQRRDDIEMG